MNKLLVVILLFTFACGNTQNTNTKPTNKPAPNKQEVANFKTIVKLETKGILKTGDQLSFSYKSNAKVKADSLHIKFNNKYLNTFFEDKFTINTNGAKTGKQKLEFKFYWPDGKIQFIKKTITLVSDIVPEEYTYKVKKTWPHSTRAYVQGLEFSDGFLYEGTGEHGKSMLTKIDLQKNEVVQSVNLAKEFFGEGITIINDKVYQLTWKSSLGFVYNKENLAKLYDFNYPTDGWGLTNNGTELIMSDGSEKIYFLETEYFSETKRLEVYDNQGFIDSLNELELIGDLLYANIYGTNNIIAIDINTGKVLKRINLTGILKQSDIKSRVDVLNGIAWNKDTKEFVVTGKWWPKLYSIELVKK